MSSPTKRSAPSPGSSPAACKLRPSAAARPRPTEQFCMSSLPRAVLELVVSFAVKDVSGVKVLPTKQRGCRRLARPDKTPLAAIAEWRLVCRYWGDILAEILTQYQKRALKINLSHKSQDQQSAALQEVLETGTKVTELRIALFGHSTRKIGAEMTQGVDWERLLSSCPNLRRLDVSKMAYLTRRDIGRLLGVASKYCLKVEVLLLPLPMGWNKLAPQFPRVYEKDEDDATLIRHLGAALERWYLRGTSGGLRQLVMPHVPTLSDEYLTAVAKFCPNVEILDGWKLTYQCDGWGAVLCDEEWRVSLQVWETFCRQCTHLREFNWAVVPFADAFFVPFGATRKCRLTEFALDFTEAFLSNDATSLQSRTSDTPRAAITSAVQLALAYSQQLVVPMESDGARFCDPTRPYSSAGLCALVQGLPFLRSLKVFLHPRYRIDLSVFDDSFLHELAKSSPYLGQFSFREAGKYAGTQALETISYHGLKSLAEMRHLSDIEIAALASTSGAGLLPFVTLRSSIIQQRNIKIGVMRRLDIVVEQLVALVAQEPAGSFRDQVFALMLVNVAHLRGFARKTCPPSEWKDRLHEARFKFQADHPTVRFQLTLEQQKPRPGTTTTTTTESFRLSKFAIFTANWEFRGGTDSIFYRGDISNAEPFTWIATC